MKTPKVFLLGLGNQKCGTTWLHQYLCGHDGFKPGFVKEFHIWDALDVPVKRQSYISLKDGLFGKRRQKGRFRMQRIRNYYFNYFNGLYSDKIHLTADITPSY